MWTILLALPALTGISQIAIGYFVLEPPNSYIRKNNRRLAIESIRFSNDFCSHYRVPHWMALDIYFVFKSCKSNR